MKTTIRLTHRSSSFYCRYSKSPHESIDAEKLTGAFPGFLRCLNNKPLLTNSKSADFRTFTTAARMTVDMAETSTLPNGTYALSKSQDSPSAWHAPGPAAFDFRSWSLSRLLLTLRLKPAVLTILYRR